ncbi:MAG: hypothetical protein ACK5TR_00125 [Alphaproteobacteria bacterium]|nr:hypothetical protein [Alphaproteobacteria bacterium]
MKSVLFIATLSGLAFASEVTYATTYCDRSFFDDPSFGPRTLRQPRVPLQLPKIQPLSALPGNNNQEPDDLFFFEQDSSPLPVPFSSPLSEVSDAKDGALTLPVFPNLQIQSKAKKTSTSHPVPQEVLESLDTAIDYLETLADEQSPPSPRDPLAEEFFMFEEDALDCATDLCQKTSSEEPKKPKASRPKVIPRERSSSAMLSSSVITPSPLSFMTRPERGTLLRTEETSFSSSLPITPSAPMTIPQPWSPSQPIAINGSRDDVTTDPFDDFKEMQYNAKKDRSPKLGRQSGSVMSSGEKNRPPKAKQSVAITVGSPSYHHMVVQKEHTALVHDNCEASCDSFEVNPTRHVTEGRNNGHGL